MSATGGSEASHESTHSQVARPFDEAERHAVAKFAEVFERSVSSYSCGGVVEVEKDSLELYYKSGTDLMDVKVLAFPATADELDHLHASATPSAYGHEGQTVHDESYRLARELKPNRIGLNFAPVGGEVIQAIAQLMGLPPHLVARLDKLNSYATGGFFKAHQDMPKGEDHTGTIVVFLSSSFTGGQLVVEQGQHTTVYDCSKQCTEGKLAWTFLYADCKHEVLPVTSGTRLTLSYDVYLPSIALSSTPTNYTSHPLYHQLESLVASPAFRPEGGLVGIGLKHAYPTDATVASDTDSWETAVMMRNRAFRVADFLASLPGRLKGIDAILYQIVRKLGVPFRFEAVYQLSSPQEYVDGEWMTVGWKLCSRDMLGSGECYEWDCSEGEMLREATGAFWAKDHVWLRDPEEYAKTSPYVAYGNQAELAWSYNAMALVLELPAENGEKRGVSTKGKGEQTEGAAEKGEGDEE